MASEKQRAAWRKRQADCRARKAGRVTPGMRQEERESRIPVLPMVEMPARESGLAVPAQGLTIAYIPDAQVKDGVPTNHLRAAGRYIARKRPDVLVCGGDFADLPSLSVHESPGHKNREGQRYRKDVDAVRRAMDELMGPIHAEPGYDPEKVFTMGNHDDYINRAILMDPKWEGTISTADLGYEQHGWKLVPYRQPVVIGGVAFCHYFPSGVRDQPITTARALLTKMHISSVAGHQQGRDVAYARRGDGKQMMGIITGSFYQHDMNYLSPFSNKHWRGMLFMHEVKDGEFDEMWLSINYLLRKHA